MAAGLKSKLKKNLPVFIIRSLNRLGLHPGFVPPVGKINWGDFKSVIPFSHYFGFDRGGPVDRYYIENFLESQSHHVKGNVLEIADNAYTLKYGGDKLIKSDVLHLNPDTPGATYSGDLSKADHLPSDHFDCIILTQTLHYIYDYKAALKHCYRILKKDGVLLLTTCGISSIERGTWGKLWLWSFNDNSMKLIFGELFPEDSFTVQTYGNIYAAITLLHGVGIVEVDKAKLDERDEAFDVIITVKLTK
ncbi:MAG: Methyltransferase type 11 [Mucilaginibacter sp.]|jgi:SAM-dependent methyltransferase|nr:Methyltransferase type 11 [Mucilaginibacter sp.]